MLTMKKRILLAFTIFAMFFGAGNLIFPPYLAYQAGRSILPAFIGFIMTAIGLPVLSLIAIGRAGSLKSLASRVHPAFGTAFTIAIYLAIGPCLAIPRTASTSYEMVAEAFGTGRAAGMEPGGGKNEMRPKDPSAAVAGYGGPSGRRANKWRCQ